MSGLNKYSLISSKEAGAFTDQNRIINFTIPEGGVYDMSQCFVQLVTRCVTLTDQVHNMCLKNSTSSLTPKNVDMIRNCWLSGDKVGKLEDITRVNVLQSNLLELTKSTTEKMCLVDSIYQVRDFQEGMLLSPWTELHKEGTSPSTYRDAYLRIPLNQLFSLGNSIIDTSKTGALTVHVELEKLTYLEFVEVKMFHSPALKDEGKFQSVTTATNQITTLAWTGSAGIKYESIEASPYFVGQKLSLSWTVEPPMEPIPVVVQGITYNVVEKTITLTIDYTFSQEPTTIYENVTVAEVEAPAGFATLSIATANLGVAEVSGGKMAGDVLEYMTWSVEQYSNNANSLEKIFEVEANAVNAFLMFNNNTSNLISNNKKVSEYRMRIDNSDVYDRNIRVNYNDEVGRVLCHDPLHYDALNRTMLNASLPLKNLTCLNMIRDTDDHFVTLAERFKGGLDRELSLLMLCTPLPLTQGMKKLQFSVSTKEAEDKVENVILFKQIIRSVKLM
jgi:hypothetical protein